MQQLQGKPKTSLLFVLIAITLIATALFAYAEDLNQGESPVEVQDLNQAASDPPQVEPPVECEVACAKDKECNDSISGTIDVCNNDGACDSFCTNVLVQPACEPACNKDRDCDDLDDGTIDVCNNDGTCESKCTNIRTVPLKEPDPEPEDTNSQDPPAEEPPIEDPAMEKPPVESTPKRNAEIKLNARGIGGALLKHNIKVFGQGNELVRNLKQFEPRGQAIKALAITSTDNGSQNIESSLIEEGTYSVELEIDHKHLKKIRLNNAAIEPEKDLLELEILDDTETGRGTAIREPFLFNPVTGFEAGSITLQTVQGTNALLKCKQWSAEEQTCLGEWEVAATFEQQGEISVEVSPEDPVFGFADITIINVQSYPVVGENWDVHFTTVGTADLVVNAVLGTVFGADLVFQSLYCGLQEIIPGSTEGNSLSFPGFVCGEESILSNLVLTTGKHALEFIFGEDTEYAFNRASWGEITTNDFNRGIAFDFNYTKVKWDNNVMPDGSLKLTNASQPAGGLVGWWKLDSNSIGTGSAIDYSGNGYDGDWLYGADSDGTWFFDQNAGFFDGTDDNVTLPVAASIAAEENSTMMAWVKTTTSSGSRIIYGEGSDPGDTLVTLFMSGSLVACYYTYDGGTTTAVINPAGVTANDNEWHHIACVKNGWSHYELYLDGVSKGTDTTTLTESSAVNNIGIGDTKYGTSHFYFPGEIAEVKTFNRSLNANEIANEYAHNKKGDGLIAYWNFDDTNSTGNGVIDLAGNDHNCLLINGANTGAWGLWDSNALFLDGDNDWVDCGSDPELSFDKDQNYTYIFNAFIGPTTMGDTSYPTLISDETSNATGWDIYYFNTTNNFSFYNDGTSIGSTFFTLDQNNSWYHIAVTFLEGAGDAMTVKMYLDGVLKNTITQNFTSSLGNLQFGAYQTPAGFLDGAIDEVKIYNRVLTAAEIAADYNAGTDATYYSEIKDLNAVSVITGVNWDALFGSEQLTALNIDVNLVGWYRFNDTNSDNNIFDSSGNMNDGYLLNGADLNATGWDDTNAGFFDGINDYTNLNPTGINIASEDQFSISAWIKTTTTDTGQMIYGEGNTGSTASVFSYVNSSRLRFFVKNNAGNGPAFSGTTWVNDGQWHHAVFIRRASDDYEIFVDGILEARNSTDSPLPKTINNTRIGSVNYNGTNYYYDGQIDELRIYNRALSSYEIRTLYAAGLNDLNLSVRLCSTPTCSGINDGNWAEFDVGNRYHSLDANVGLVLDLNFNDTNSDGSGVLDASLNGNNGLLINGADINAVGKDKSRAGFFDGVNDYIEIKDSASLDLPRFSISAWVKLNSIGTEDIIVSKGWFDESGGGPMLGLYSTYYMFGDESTAPTNNARSATHPTVGIWTHLVGTYDGSTARIYVNGIKEGNKVLSMTMNNSNRIKIGAGYYNAIGPAYYSTGQIDNVKIYNRTLSDGEIMGLYLKGSPQQFVQYKAEFVHSDANFAIGYGYLNDVAIEYNSVPDANIWRIDGNDASAGLPIFRNAKSGNLTIDYNISDRDNYDKKTAEVFYSTTPDYGQSTKISSGLQVDGNACTTNLINGWELNETDANLVGYWKFDGVDATNLMVADHSGKNYNGLKVSGQENGVNGKWDTNGFDSNTTAYIELPTIQEPLSNWTVISWFKSDTQGSQHTIVSQDKTGWNDDFLFGIAPEGVAADRPSNNTIGAILQEAGDSNRYSVEDDSEIIIGKWYHTAVSYDGATMKLYVDGTLKDTNAGIGLDIGKSNHWAIGENPAENHSETYRAFDGTIEEVKIYDKALLASMIAQDYDLGLVNYRKCSIDWDPSALGDQNYFVGAVVTDQAGSSGMNTSAESFKANYLGECPTSGNWVIDNSNQYILSSVCNAPRDIHIVNGTLRIDSTGTLVMPAAKRIIIEKANNSKLVIDSGGKLAMEKCNGWADGGYCWYAGESGESCDTACTSHGGCVAENWNDDTSCTLVEAVVKGSSCGVCAENNNTYQPSFALGPQICFYRSAATAQDCSASTAGNKRLCACNN